MQTTVFVCPGTKKYGAEKTRILVLHCVHTAVSTAPLSSLKNFVVLSENEIFHGCRVLIDIRNSLSINKKASVYTNSHK